MLIRKNGFTEVVSFENGKIVHEMGDKISRASVREAVFVWIKAHEKAILEEYNKASSYSKEYKPSTF